MKLPESYRATIIFVKQLIRKLLMLGGIFLFVSILFSFTDYPFWAYYWLGTHNADLEKDPDVVVLMGGGGMPSPDGLIRCYFAAKIGSIYPESKIIVAVPADTALKEESPELLMRAELIMRNIDSTRILFETVGVNTRSQSLNISRMFPSDVLDTLGVRIVTSPEHMYRSVAAFRKVGFCYVGGQPSFEMAINEKLLVEKIKGVAQPSDLKALNFRYNMWNYLKYEITVGRELCAITYYKLRGWI